MPDTGDSEKQDAGKGEQYAKPTDKKRRIKTVPLYDNGKYGDNKAGDGIFTTALNFADLKPGLLQVQLVSKLQYGRLTLTREATTSYYVRR